MLHYNARVYSCTPPNKWEGAVDKKKEGQNWAGVGGKGLCCPCRQPWYPLLHPPPPPQAFPPPCPSCALPPAWYTLPVTALRHN